MRKYLETALLCALTVTLAACGGMRTVRLPDGSLTNKRIVMIQSGIVVSVVNNCAPLLDIESVGGRHFINAKFGESVTVTGVARPLSGYGYSRRIQFTVKGYSADRTIYLGSSTREFSVSTYEGTHEETWVVDQLALPTNQGGCRVP